MQRAQHLLALVPELAKVSEAAVLLVVTDDSDIAREASKISAIPVVLATSRRSLEVEFADRIKGVLRLSEPVDGTLSSLAAVKDVVMGAVLSGAVGAHDRLLVLLSNEDALAGILAFDAGKDFDLTRLETELAERLDLAVAERIMKLASDIAREGREGKPVGTLFVLGDADAVLARSRQAVINPFKGYAPAERNILDDALEETLKEFALIDGAFVIRENGVIEAAGRYIETDHTVPLASGLGGRHLAAASITKMTRAIAFTVSSSGAVRVYKDGKPVMRFGKI